jgi:hypothetical protein
VGFQKTPGEQTGMWKADSNVPVSYCINSVPDPFIFAPPGSGSEITCLEPFIATVLLLLINLLLLMTDVTVPRVISKKIFSVGILKVTEEKSRDSDPDPVLYSCGTGYGSADPDQNV